MGNALYQVTRSDGKAIAAGYDVTTICEHKGCHEEINRGLAYLCGNTPGGDEYGCGGYYCYRHLYLGSGAPVSEGLCKRCSDAYEKRQQEEATLPA